MIPEVPDCEVCRERPARIVCLRRRREDTDRTFVCQACAAERARLYTGGGLDLDRIVTRSRSARARGAAAFACEFCGTTMADIVTDGKPGCCWCYWRFAGEIEQRISTAQGVTRHLGKAPPRE